MIEAEDIPMSRMKRMQDLECPRAHRNYTEAERRSVVAEFERRRAAGEIVQAIAGALGVSRRRPSTTG